MIYVSFRFRQVPDGACATLIEPLELEMKSRLLVLFAYGDLCRVRHGLGSTGYSEDDVDGKNEFSSWSSQLYICRPCGWRGVGELSNSFFRRLHNE